MYQLALWIVLLFPFIGLILIKSSPDDYDWLTMGNDSIVPLAYYSIFLIGAATAALRFNKQQFRITIERPRRARSEYPLLLVLLTILTIVLIGYDGLNVLLGSASKEDVRQSGLVHAILTKYLAPAIFAYFSALRRARIVSRSGWQLSMLVTVTIGLSMGGKASVLIAILPGMAILFGDKLSPFGILLIVATAFASLLATAWLFDSFLEGDMGTIAKYLVRRAFALTAEAPFHASMSYRDGQPIIEYHYTLLEVFGKSVLANFVSPHELHKFIFSHAVTAWLYPDNIDAITSGAWNITPNVFVESLIVGGNILLPLFGWAVVYGAYALWARVVRQINRGRFASAAVTSVYSVLVYLSWTNSAGIMQLIHPLAIGSLALSWLCLNALSRVAAPRRRALISRTAPLTARPI